MTLVRSQYYLVALLTALLHAIMHYASIQQSSAIMANDKLLRFTHYSMLCLLAVLFSSSCSYIYVPKVQ